MSTGIKLKKAVRLPLNSGGTSYIVAPVGTPVELREWTTDNRGCYKAKIELWLSGYQVVYDGPLREHLIDIDWDIIAAEVEIKDDSPT